MMRLLSQSYVLVSRRLVVQWRSTIVSSATVLKNGLVLPNDQGTAPGLIYQADGKMLIMLPGPTHELTNV